MVRGPSTMVRGSRSLAVVLVLILAALASGGPCPEKEAAIQALARGDDGRAGRDGLVALLATAMLMCGAADSDLLLAMGSVLYGRGDSAGALRCWRAGWRLSPLSVGLANNVAAALIDISRPVDAIAALRVLEHRLFLARQPATAADWWKTDINMASAMAELDDLRGSAGRLQRALAHPALTDSNPQKPVAAANLIYTRRRLCDWKAFESDVQMAAQLVRRQLTGAFDFLLPGALPVDPFMALTFLPPGARRSDGDGSIGPEQVLAATYRFARACNVPEALHLTGCRAPGFPMAGGGAGWSAGAGRRGGRAKFVVGYVCSEFGRRHSVMLLMRAVFERHNRATVRVLCFSTRPLPHSSADRPGSFTAHRQLHGVCRLNRC